MAENIAIINLADISTVQGSTEGYYVAHRLSKDYNVHIYSTSNPAVKSATYHHLPSIATIPSFFLYNLILIPYFIYHSWKYRLDIIYTYKGFNISPYVVSIFTKADWIADFRTKPTGQEKEFNTITENSSRGKNLYYMLQDFAYRSTLPFAKAIITLSEPLCDHLVENYNVDQNKILLVPLGVDTNYFKQDKNEDFEECTLERLDLVYVGSISRLRGFETCIEALTAATLQPDVQLHLVGNGSNKYLQDLKTEINSKGVKDAVTWHGYINHDKLPELLSEMDVAISPLPEHDSYHVSSPAKIYEYLAMGLPIVCTDIYPHRELLQNGRTGFFYEPGSPDDLVTSLNHIWNLEANTWHNIRHEARQTALDNNWSIRLETIKEVIEK